MQSPRKSTRAPDARVARTRNALRKGLLDLLSRKSFEQITVREITAHANTGYATFFRHFPSLDDLLSDIAADEMDNLIAHAFPALRSGGSKASCEALCAYVDSERDLWRSLLTGGAWAQVRETCVRKAAALVTEEEQDSEEPVPANLAVIFGTSAMLDIIAWWLHEGSKRPISEIANYINRLAISPLVSPEPF